MTEKELIKSRKLAADILKTVFNKKEKCKSCGKIKPVYKALGVFCFYCGGEIIYE